MSSKFRFVSFVLAVLLALVLAQNAFATGIDQKQETFSIHVGIIGAGPIGQEFRPSLSILEAVQVRLSLPGPADTITLNVREGTISGTILATAAVSLPSGFQDWAYFALGSVSVIPGSTYVIHLSATEMFSYWSTASPFGGGLNNPYPRGRAIHNGLPHEDEDRTFRTYGPGVSVGGVVLPNNTLTVLAPYLAMIGLVATAIAARKRRN